MRGIKLDALIGVSLTYALFGPYLIDLMTASENVRLLARDYFWLVAFAPLLSVFAFTYDGVFIGATWSRDIWITVTLDVNRSNSYSSF